MSFSPEHFTSFWIVAGALLYGLLLLMAFRRTDWWRIRDPHDLNVLICTILGIVLIWTMKAEYVSTLSLHLIGATLLTMMFGWSYAILAISIVISVTTVFQGGSWSILPWNILITGILPIFISYRIFRFADHRLPNNFFVYIFICAFFGAAVAMSSVILATTAIHIMSGAFSMEYIGYNYFPYGLLLMFPEAFITGMLMSIFVAYRPQWVSTFDDQRYLQKQ